MRSPVVFCLLVYVNLVVSYSPAGIYIDNGFDQTVIERIMSKQEKRELELEILHLLGLPNRPRRNGGTPLKKSAPKFLLDVYQSLVEKENYGRDKRSADLNLSGEEEKAIDESDMIMTFESINHHVSGVRHERGKRLWFDVSSMAVENTIVGAELRLYQNFGYNNGSTKPDTKYTVTAYQLVNSLNGERELEYVASVNTTADFSGWLELNITDSLSSWVAFPDSNKGLYLSVHPADKPAHEIRPEDIGLAISKEDDEIQPFMVAFLKTTNYVKVRTTRAINKRVKKSDYSPASLMKNAIQNTEAPATDWRSCKLHTLYISFKDLQWQDWIIAPDGYAAFYCAGECNFPLNAHMNATNHAIVQTLVHLMNPTKFPKPCCAPTKLSQISVLFFSDTTNVTLKKYRKMVVKSCGCH